jgi:hypothetical protein
VPAGCSVFPADIYRPSCHLAQPWFPDLRAHARGIGITAPYMSGRTNPEPDALDQYMLAVLSDHGIELVVSAGT